MQGEKRRRKADGTEPERRRFMVGAAGLTFGVVAGVPELLLEATARARAARRRDRRQPVGHALDRRHGVHHVARDRDGAGLAHGDSGDPRRRDGRRLEQGQDRAGAAERQALRQPALRRNAMYTAGSATVTGYFTPMRQFGAQVRYVLMDNAARHWNVPHVRAHDRARASSLHEKSGRRLAYGEIAAFATVPAKAPEIALEPLDEGALPPDRQRRHARRRAGQGERHRAVQHRRAGAGHDLRRDPAPAGRRRRARARRRRGGARDRRRDRDRAAEVRRRRARGRRRGPRSRRRTRSR